MQFSWKNTLRALPVLLLLAASAAFGAAGSVQFVIGDVKLVNKAGVTTALQKGAEINEGDKIVTAAGASAQLKMADGGFIAVRPDTSMTFDTYRYSGKEDGTESAVVSLLQGGFRTITGLIGRTNKQNYLIKTETATIGIRGTDHEPMVILAPAPGRTAIAAPGTYDKVNVGVAFIRTDAGSVDIQRNQVGFAPVTKAAPVILPRIPPFYKPTPAPGPQKAKEETKEEGKKDSTQTAAATTAGEEKKAAAPAEKAATSEAAAAPAAASTTTTTQQAADASAPIRNTAIVDPTTTITTAPSAAPVATAPAVVAPVVAITATNASGSTLNTTTQTTATASGTTTPIAQTPITPPPVVQPPGAGPPPVTPVIGSPIVAASSYGFGVTGAKPVSGGVELVSFGSPSILSTSPNTDFVLSDKSLVEVLKSSYQRVGMNYLSQSPINVADVKFSGGAAADILNDANGTYYMGRWTGGQIAVTDLATTSPVAPFSDSLGTNSVHWVLGVTPGNLAGTQTNNVQQLIGTANYTLAAATHPTDGFGNVGTLNSATLAANFSKQTIDGGLNLSFSSADTVNLSKRNLNLTASATNVPIQKGGFDISVIPQIVSIPGIAGIPGLNNTVTCSGADCAAGGYFGMMGGSFLASASGGTTSGAVGTGVGLTYGFAPIPTTTPAANQPYADFITGAAVLSSAAAPTAGTNAAPVTGGTGTYRQQIVMPVTVGTTTYNSNYSLASGAVVGAQNYVYDASGNLVRMQSSDYKLSERGGSGPPSYTANAPVPYTGTVGGLPTSPLTGATVSFSGGTAPDGSYNDTVNGIRMGRWTGGTITTTDLSTPTAPATYFTPIGSNSLTWAVRELPAAIPLTGTFDYALAYSTKPTDSLGNIGTLNYASLSANFTSQTVSPAVGITINNQTLMSAASNVPIASNFGFDVSSSSAQNTGGGNSEVQVKCFGSNCAPAPVGGSGSYGGRFNGGLAGSAAGGAFFRYDFNTRYDPAVAAGATGGIPTGVTRPVNDYIQGMVAFTKGTGVAAPVIPTATSGNQAFSTTYFYPGTTYYQWQSGNYNTSATSFTSAFGTGSPNTITDMASPSDPTPASETLTGGTVVSGPTNATSFASTGISFGRYVNGTVTGVDWQGTAFTRANSAVYQWIKGPDTGLMNSAMRGTATYVYDGGIAPSNLTGTVTGTINSAVLAVNFNTSSVGVDLSVTEGNTWTASTTAPVAGALTLTGSPPTTIRLSEGGSFYASSWNAGNPALHESLYVAKNGATSPSIGGQINGQLTGYNLGGAIMTYGFQDMTAAAPGGVKNGAVAFALGSYTTDITNITTTGTSAIDPNNVAYMLGLGASGLTTTPALTTTVAGAPVYSPASIEPGQYLANIQGGAIASGRTSLDANGLPIQWDGRMALPVLPPTGCTTGCTPWVTDLPVRLTIDPTRFVATGVTPAAGSGQMALPAGLGIASVLESGFDAATGIRWGRYGAGVIGVFDRVGGGLGPQAWDVSKQNFHMILGPNQAGPTTLPVTGTYTYTNVGGTKPTDNLGSAAGTLNAATLVADFGAQTVNSGVNLTVNGQTWAAGGTAIPIQQRTFFEAGRKPDGTGNLNVCVGSTCGTTTLPSASANSLNTAGRIAGGFVGSTGQGAAVAYSLNQGGITGTTVSGVAAFKR